MLASAVEKGKNGTEKNTRKGNGQQKRCGEGSEKKIAKKRCDKRIEKNRKMKRVKTVNLNTYTRQAYGSHLLVVKIMQT